MKSSPVYNNAMPFRPQGNPNAGKRGRTPPPEDTLEEASFLKSLGEKQKAVSVKLMDGETVRGWIEYYDKNMIRLTREGAPNLFIFKHEIMYIADDGAKQKYLGIPVPAYPPQTPGFLFGSGRPVFAHLIQLLGV